MPVRRSIFYEAIKSTRAINTARSFGNERAGGDRQAAQGYAVIDYPTKRKPRTAPTSDSEIAMTWSPPH